MPSRGTRMRASCSSLRSKVSRKTLEGDGAAFPTLEGDGAAFPTTGEASSCGNLSISAGSHSLISSRSLGVVRIMPLLAVPVGPHGAKAPMVEILIPDSDLEVDIAGVEERR